MFNIFKARPQNSALNPGSSPAYHTVENKIIFKIITLYYVFQKNTTGIKAQKEKIAKEIGNILHQAMAELKNSTFSLLPAQHIF
jgi:hypothetical protein